MTDKNLCVSLETARLLKDAGFPQDTHFNWCEHSKEIHIWDCPHKDDPAAPTTDELLLVLPGFLLAGEKKWALELRKRTDCAGWLAGYKQLFAGGNPHEALACLFLDLAPK